MWRSRSSCWPGAGKRHGSLGRNNVLIKKESCWPPGPERRPVDKKLWLWGQCAQTTFAYAGRAPGPQARLLGKRSAVTQVVPPRWFPSAQWVHSGGGSQAPILSGLDFCPWVTCVGMWVHTRLGAQEPLLPGPSREVGLFNNHPCSIPQPLPVRVCTTYLWGQPCCLTVVVAIIMAHFTDGVSKVTTLPSRLLL